MVNQKGIFIFVILFLLGIFLVSSGLFEESKIDMEVYDSFEESEYVRVIVKIDVDSEEGIIFRRILSEDEIKIEKENVINEVINEVGYKNINHVFEDSVAVKVNLDELKELEEIEDVGEIIIDVVVKAFLQDSVVQVNASTVWPIQLSSTNITGIDETVCVIDTGADFIHPDLVGKNLTCVIDCIERSCIENCSRGDDHGHGTHISGIIGASGGIYGMAGGIGLIAVKALNSSGAGFSTDVRSAIDWCSDQDNIDSYNISVISMSLGSGLYSDYCNNDFLAASINTAVLRNVSVIIATGNDGNSTGISSPACVQNATSVGATDKSDVIVDSYSNRNYLTDLFAPGGTANDGVDGINSTQSGGGYTGIFGTSMAAPHVAGGFALFRQYYNLQNGRIPTPGEIQDELNSTGFQINDTSGQGLNFSRIDVLAAIISIDNSNPVVSLVSPANGTTQLGQNVSFRCSANDAQLSNLTLYLWNSTDEYNTSFVTALTNIEYEFNVSDIDYDDYEWNCLAVDDNLNSSFASLNYSLTVGKIETTLNSPANGVYSNFNHSYNCSSETESAKELANVTFSIWNTSSDLLFNETKNLSGIINSTVFDFNIILEGNYSWNCESFNNETESDIGNSNYSFDYDVTLPNITLTNPVNSSSYSSNSQEIIFNYNVTDNSIGNCSLIIDDSVNSTNSTIIDSINQSFTENFGPATYEWRINCTDSALNLGNSSQRTFTVSAPAVVVSGGGGGGGGGTLVSKTYSASVIEASSGYTKSLGRTDKIEFTFFDELQESHSLTIDTIGLDFARLTIRSEIIKLTLGIGQSVKLNLTNLEYYDLYVKLNSIIGSKAEITIQTIHEIINVKTVTGDVVNEEIVERVAPEDAQELNRKDYKIDYIIVIAILVVLLFLIIIWTRHRKVKFEEKIKNLKNGKKKKGK